jgi:hypothetical protein
MTAAVPHLLQVTPSAATRAERAAASGACGAEEAAAAAEVTENLRIMHVPTVEGDTLALAAAAARTHLAAALRHHVTPAADALVVAGPFGIGKRRLLQRMLALYPSGFALPPVYTTAPGASGGTLRVVDQAFVDALGATGHVAFRQDAVGSTYVASKVDLAECVHTLPSGAFSVPLSKSESPPSAHPAAAALCMCAASNDGAQSDA